MAGMANQDAWVRQHQQAKQIADGVMADIQERNEMLRDGLDAAKLTAACRRRLGSLGGMLERLATLLHSNECKDITEMERTRRGDLISVLRDRREQMANLISRSDASARGDARDALLEGSSSRQGQETEVTAGLDNRGILQLQNQMMAGQDDDIESLSRVVSSTRHIALAVNEELDLHVGLLDELEEDVDATQARFKVLRKKLRRFMERSGNCKSMLCSMVLITSEGAAQPCTPSHAPPPPQPMPWPCA
mmetsp:Transcript_4318/g.13851  ORF Transcript_4318/g.13851 Transcript_4318/m.13851 type:complete len:249 (+) Transcript_4318:1182-1928(+)